MSDVEIDCKDQSCPMPIVNISRIIKKMEAGQTLKVEACDPAFHADLEAWCKKLGHELESFEDGAVQTALVRKN